jgi:tryptophan synthase alpha chain
MKNNRIDARFEQLAAADRAGFIPFFTAGDPDPDCTIRLLRGCEEAGADVIELGFPFSDPIADGPTIQDSYHRVLSRAQSVEDIFGMVRQAREGCDLPIVAMASYSIVFRIGLERFVERCLAAGIDGATIPDLPVDEAAGMIEDAARSGFRLICFCAPSTTPERQSLVVRHAHGFIYYMAVRGITGERDSLPTDLFEHLEQLRALTRTPVAVGFGISQPGQARVVGRVADGVIVGSAIVKRMAAAAAEGSDAAEAALGFIREMSEATRGARLD